ncbi:MAG: DUF2520 domain-containing protein [Acidimicrobiales bacterium]
MRRRVRIVGGGRAGGAFALALGSVGWSVVGVLGRDDDPRDAASDVDLVLIATPDAAVAVTAATIEPDPETVVAHVAGSLGLGVLAGHPRRGALHPLMSLPDPEAGARLLLGGGIFAVAGDPLAGAVVDDLGGRTVEVSDEHRVLYHAAACVASNHLVALLGQVERLAEIVGVPFEAYLDLVAGTVANVGEVGPAAALTGPAARGDVDTIRRHLAALPFDERPGYEAMVAEARRLAGGTSGGERG